MDEQVTGAGSVRELARTKGLGAAAYAPIAQALSTLSEDEPSKSRFKVTLLFLLVSISHSLRRD
jgi:hypothetical protein